MKKGFWRLGTMAALLFVFAACNEAAYEPVVYLATEEAAEIVEAVEAVDYVAVYENPQETEVDEYEDYVQEIAETAAQPEPPAHYFDIFASGRTRGEYLEDLDHLYSTLAANFPFFGVIYRARGVDMHERYRIAREYIEAVGHIRDDAHFAEIINHLFIGRARSAGHFDMLQGEMLRLHIEVFSNQVARYGNQFLYFLYELDNPATRALHGLTDESFAPPVPGEGSLVFATTSNNIETRIIEPGRIAYVNILSMSHATMRLDRETLLDFYHHIADFDHLIIDIRQNGGGDARFFSDLVIAPNISEPLEYHFYMLMMDGGHNRRLLETWFGSWWEDTPGYSTFRPIHDDLLYRLIYLNADDAQMLEFYWARHGLIQPSQAEAIFGGKIWLLVGERNFSASEQAAAISRQTGFATLVGETTGGDGIGINPLVLALPNSGVVVRFSPVYGTDPLGRNNQEFGTDPHVFNRPRRDALQTTLELIAEGNW